MEQDQVGRLPLHNACSNQASLEVIQYLVEEYPEGVIETTMRGSIPLLCACESGHYDPRVISYLIDQDPESILFNTIPSSGTGSKSGSNKDNNGSASVQRNSNSIRSMQGDSRRSFGMDGNGNGDDNTNCDNTEKGGDVAGGAVNGHDSISYKLGKTPLHAACARGVSLDIVQLLIHANSRLIYSKDSWGRTPLYCACTNPKIEIDTIDYLLSILNNNTVQEPDRSGQLPIHAVCANANATLNDDYLVIVEAILDSYPYAIQMKDKNGRVALHAALSTGHATIELIDMLVNTYPDALQILDVYGQLPLHMALQRKNSLDVIQYLIQQYPDSIYKREWKVHRLPFHIACSVGCKYDILVYLLSLYPKAILKNDKDNNTSLNLACTSMLLTKKTARWLIDISPINCCEHINHFGSNVLHIACSNKIKLSILYMLLEQNELLLEMKDNKDRYPLHRAFMVRTPIPTLVRLAQSYPDALKKRDHQRYIPTDYASDDIFKAFSRARTSYNLRHAYAPCCIKEDKILQLDIDSDDEVEIDPNDEKDGLLTDNDTNKENKDVDHTGSTSNDHSNSRDDIEDSSKYTMSLNPYTGRSERKLIT